jgi:hypothetical protein
MAWRAARRAKGSSGACARSARISAGRWRAPRERASRALSAVGVLLVVGLVPPSVRRADVILAKVALAAQRDRPRAASWAMMPQIQAMAKSCTAPGSGPDTQMMPPSELAMTCRFIPCFAVLARIERPSAATRSAGINAPSIARQGVPGALGLPSPTPSAASGRGRPAKRRSH